MTTLAELQTATVMALQHKMSLLGLSVTHVGPISSGPVVSVYRFQPRGSTKVSHIEALSQDFAVTLGVEDVFVKRMPGETSVGIFVPNTERQYVQWRDICTIKDDKLAVPLVLGIDFLGRTSVVDLAQLPHLLMAGSTGAGKSTLLSSLITTLILNRPELKLVLVDLKGVEFNHFDKAPQLHWPITTTCAKATERLEQLITEMERRLKLYAQTNTRNIYEYNATKTLAAHRLPFFCVIIDELADLLTDDTWVEQDEGRGTTLGKTASRKLAELARKARASGIHIIAATQRPSVKLLEGDIKANFPARIAFRLPSEADSRTVLSQGGAEHLLSRGDMLFIDPNRPGLSRIHAPLASVQDILAAMEFALHAR
jgi:DNA segregation ATPase FtsK/SpoIIIE, S-DNA-T family